MNLGILLAFQNLLEVNYISKMTTTVGLLEGIIFSLDCCNFLILYPILESGPEIIKLFSCSTQLSTKLQQLIKLKYRQIKMFLILSLSDVVLIMLINVKMQALIGILTFMSRINFMHG